MPPTEKNIAAEDPVKKEHKQQKEPVEKKTSVRKVNSSINETQESQGAGETPVKPRPKKKKPRENLATPNSNPVIADVPKKNAQRAKGSTSLNKTIQRGETEPTITQHSPAMSADIIVEGKENTTPKVRTQIPKKKKRKPESTARVQPKEASKAPEKEIVPTECPVEKDLDAQQPTDTKLQDLPPRAYTPSGTSCSFFERLQQGVKAYFSSRSSFIPDERNKKEGGIRNRGTVAKGVKEDAKKSKAGVKLINKINNTKTDSTSNLSVKPKNPRNFQRLKLKKFYHPKKHYVRIQKPREGYFYRSSVGYKILHLPSPECLQLEEKKKRTKQQIVGTSSTNSKKRAVKKQLDGVFPSASSEPENKVKGINETISGSMQRCYEYVLTKNAKDGEETTGTKDSRGQKKQSEVEVTEFPHEILRAAENGTCWNVVRSELSLDSQIRSLQFGPTQPRPDVDRMVPLAMLLAGFSDLDLATLDITDNFGALSNEELERINSDYDFLNFLIPQNNKGRTENHFQSDFSDNYIPLKIHSSGQKLQNRTAEFPVVGETKCDEAVDTSAPHITELEETSDEMLLHLSLDPVLGTRNFDDEVAAKNLSEQSRPELTNSESRLLFLQSEIQSGSNRHYEKILPYKIDSKQSSELSPLNEYEELKFTAEKLLESFSIEQIGFFKHLREEKPWETCQVLLQEMNELENKLQKNAEKETERRKVETKSEQPDSKSKKKENRNPAPAFPIRKKKFEKVTLKQKKKPVEIKPKTKKSVNITPKRTRSSPHKETKFPSRRKLDSHLTLSLLSDKHIKAQKKVFVTVNTKGKEALVNRRSNDNKGRNLTRRNSRGTSQLIIEKVTRENKWVKAKKPKITIRDISKAKTKKPSGMKKLTGMGKKEIDPELLYSQLSIRHPISSIREIPEKVSESVANAKEGALSSNSEKEVRPKDSLYRCEPKVRKKLTRVRPCVRDCSSRQKKAETTRVKSMVELKKKDGIKSSFYSCKPGPKCHSTQSLQKNTKNPYRSHFRALPLTKQTKVRQRVRRVSKSQTERRKKKPNPTLKSGSKAKPTESFGNDLLSDCCGVELLLVDNKEETSTLIECGRPFAAEKDILEMTATLTISNPYLHEEVSVSGRESLVDPVQLLTPKVTNSWADIARDDPDSPTPTPLTTRHFNFNKSGSLRTVFDTPALIPDVPYVTAVDLGATIDIEKTQEGLKAIENFIDEIFQKRKAAKLVKKCKNEEGKAVKKKTSSQSQIIGYREHEITHTQSTRKKQMENAEKRNEKPGKENKRQIHQDKKDSSRSTDPSVRSRALLSAIKSALYSAEGVDYKDEILVAIEKGLSSGQLLQRLPNTGSKLTLKIIVHREEKPAVDPIRQDVPDTTALGAGEGGDLPRVESEYFDAMEPSGEEMEVGDGWQTTDSRPTDPPTVELPTDERPISAATSSSEWNDQAFNSKKLLALIEIKSKNLMMKMEMGAWQKVLLLLKDVFQVFEAENTSFLPFDLKTAEDVYELHYGNLKSLSTLLKCYSVIIQADDSPKKTFVDKLKGGWRFLKDKLTTSRRSDWGDYNGDVDLSGPASASLPEISDRYVRRRHREETEEARRRLKVELTSIRELIAMEADHVDVVSQEIDRLKNEVAEKMQSLEEEFDRLIRESPPELGASWEKATALLRLGTNCRQGNSSQENIGLGRRPGCADLLKCVIKAWDTRMSISSIRNKCFN